MLRFIFEQPKRVDDGMLLHSNEAISQFCERLTDRPKINDWPEMKSARLSLWATGLKSALNELEQSKYCSLQYSLRMNKRILKGMEANELDDYRLHVFFYKSALVRIFSTLDKLGNFMNELLDLETEKVKEKFSYFTVLRNLYKVQVHRDLEKKLFGIKVANQSAMSELRRKRNMEIHYLNAEMLDDLKNLSKDILEPSEIEDLVLNISLLQQGYDMVCESLFTVFNYSNEFILKR